MLHSFFSLRALACGIAGLCVFPAVFPAVSYADAVLVDDGKYRVRLRAMLNTERYPAALRVLFFWRGQWQLQSEWFEWFLER